VFSQDDHEPNIPTFTPQVDQSQTSKWKSLQAARDEKAGRPTTAKSNISGKAPLDPNSRPKSGLSKQQFRGRPESGLSNKSGRSGISPNQRVGKYTQLAMQTEGGVNRSNLSQVSNSPQRIGKYAQMALGANTSATNLSKISNSPQRVGKYAQMAL